MEMSVSYGGEVIRTHQPFLFGQTVESIWNWDHKATVVFCKDSPLAEGDGGRSQLHEGYKIGREHNPEVYKLQNEIEEMMCCLPFVRFATGPGMEADDVMAQLFFQLKEKYPGNESIIYCGDNDLLQLIPHGARIARKFNQGAFEFIGQPYVDEKFGIELQYLLRFRTLVGDTSDKIPGLWPRLNKEKAKQFARSWYHNGLESAVKDATIDYMFLDKIKANMESLKRNISLMSLEKYISKANHFPLKVYRRTPDLMVSQDLCLGALTRFITKFVTPQ